MTMELDLLVYLTPKPLHEHVALLVNGVYVAADTDGYLAVKPCLAALVEPAGDEYFVTLAQDDIGYYLLKSRLSLSFGSGHILMLIADDFKQLRHIFGYKAVFACNKFFDLFSFYN